MTSTNLYFFDGSLNLRKIVTSKNINAALHEQELNGLIICNIEMDMQYTKQFINDVDYVGYYVKGVYHLHHIKRVEDNHEDESVLISGRHIFFEDMLYGEYIRDVRPQNQEASFVLRQTIEANTRWQIVMTDSTKRLSGNHYWQSPMEVLNDVVERYAIEYEPRILFDGQKINGYQLHVANRIGSDKDVRIPYGHRVLNLKYEIDYSEVVTALYGHGKGEEVGDGYGRRINIENVNFSRNGAVSPVGQLYIENPVLTSLYGKDDGSPKFGRVVFEDIESPSDLAEATYEAYLEQSKPKMLFEASVADIGDVGMGDSVLIIRRERDVYFSARIHKSSVDLLYQEDMDVELGDYQHFKESKVARKTRENNNQWQRQTSSRIQQLKEDFNSRFDGEVDQMKEEFEQALIDARAEIEARRARMEAEWQQQWDEGMEAYERDKQQSYEEMHENIDRITNEVTAAITSTRNELEIEYNRLVAEAKETAAQESERIERDITETIVNTRSELENTILDAEQSARDFAEIESKRKADEVQSNLDSVTGQHQGMIDDLRSNVMNIDNFIGDRSIPLNEMLYNERMRLEEQINNIDTWHYNMLRGTRFDEDFWEPINGTIENDEVNYFKSNINADINVIRSKEEMFFRSGETYLLSFDVQTYAHRSIDYVWILDREGSANYNITALADSQTALVMYWGAEYQRYWVKFTPNRDVYGVLQIGANSRNNELGRREFRIRLPYLTQTDNTQWLYHQLDNVQNLEEITRRVTKLEDGREEFITRTEYDHVTGDIQGTMRQIRETVDISENIIQNHNNWILNEGSHTLQMADLVSSKVWMDDIYQPNMIPFTAVHELEHRLQWSGYRTNSTGASYNEFARVRNTNSLSQIGIESPQFDIQQGGHVATWEAFIFSDSVDHFTYCYLMHSSGNISLPNPTRTVVSTPPGSYAGRTVYKYTLRFNVSTALKGVRFMIGARVITPGSDASFSFRYPKLEVGNDATSYFSAFSAMEQRADSMFFAIQGIGDDAFLTQSDIQIRADYVQLGSQRLGDNQLASILRVSPNSIDAITNQLNLTGNLNVKGQIESLSISAIEANIDNIIANHLSANVITGQHIDAKTINVGHIVINDALVNTISSRMVFADSVTALSIQAIEGEFARLFASEFEAIKITGQHIDSKTINSSHINVNDALINLIVARRAFVDEISTLSLNAIDADIGRVRAAILTANVINSGHIEANTIGVNQINVNDALINVITARQAFIREIRTISIEAVEADIGRVRAILLDANVIRAEHIQASNALIDKLFASTAYIENLTAKAAFVRDVRAISIDAFEINLTTLMNSMGQVEGGLSIRRPDGDYYFNNGMAVFDFGVQMTEFRDPNIDFNGQWWETSSANQQRFNIGSFKHVGRKLKLNLMLRLSGYSPSISEWMYFRVWSFGGSINYDRQIRVLVRRTQVESMTFEVDLPRLTHGMSSFYVSIWRDSDGAHADNIVQARINRTWVDS